MHINDINIGDKVKTREGTICLVDDITDRKYDHINHSSSDLMRSARIKLSYDEDGWLFHCYRFDGISHYSPKNDIIELLDVPQAPNSEKSHE